MGKSPKLCQKCSLNLTTCKLSYTHSIWGLNLNILFYKQAEMSWLVVSGSITWAFAMIGLAALLSKINIRIKL
jgi:hypothetical protein